MNSTTAVATPHTGGLTPQAMEHQRSETSTALTELLARRMPARTLNPAQATRLHLACASIPPKGP